MLDGKYTDINNIKHSKMKHFKPIEMLIPSIAFLFIALIIPTNKTVTVKNNYSYEDVSNGIIDNKYVGYPAAYRLITKIDKMDSCEVYIRYNIIDKMLNYSELRKCICFKNNNKYYYNFKN